MTMNIPEMSAEEGAKRTREERHGVFESEGVVAVSVTLETQPKYYGTQLGREEMARLNVLLQSFAGYTSAARNEVTFH